MDIVKKNWLQKQKRSNKNDDGCNITPPYFNYMN